MGSLGSWIDPEEFRRLEGGGAGEGAAGGEPGPGEVDALAAIAALLSEPAAGEVEPLIEGGLDDEQAYLEGRFPSPVSESVAAIRKTLAELGESGREQGLFSGGGGGGVVEARAGEGDAAGGSAGGEGEGSDDPVLDGVGGQGEAGEVEREDPGEDELRRADEDEGELRFVVDLPTALAREKASQWLSEKVGEELVDEASGAVGSEEGQGGGARGGAGGDGGEPAADGVGDPVAGGRSAQSVATPVREDLGGAVVGQRESSLGSLLGPAIDQLMAVTFSRGASVFDGEGYEVCCRGESLAVAIVLPVLRAWRRLEEEMGAGVAGGLGVDVAGRRVELWPLDASRRGGIVVVLSGAASFGRPDLEEVSRVLGV